MKPAKAIVALSTVLLTACGAESNTIDVSAENQTANINKTSVATKAPVEETATAFPGAYGGGVNATGGRGGTVYVVTSLADTNTAGTLRYAVGKSGARYIVFAVSGTIHLTSQLSIKNGNLTIMGQTAPGDGICLADYPVSLGASNVIIRYLRFRMGDLKLTADAADGADAFGGRFQQNVIIDHCSVSWSTDECCSFYVNKNFTLQWCIISESLRYSLHSKGAHGYGAIWGGVNASFHHNLMAHHDSRTPRFGTGNGMYGQDYTDMRNNVFYNWNGNGCYGAETMYINIVNNYYKPGPGTLAKIASRIIGIDGHLDTSTNTCTWGKYYIAGNYNPNYPTVNSDNWNGVTVNSKASTVIDGVKTKDDVRADVPFSVTTIPEESALECYPNVLSYAGCSLKRDAIDERIVNETRNGTTTYIGKSTLNSGNYPRPGIIDSQQDLKPADAAADWSAWPTLNSLTAPADTDGDGMPDEWETANGTDPNVKDANAHTLSTGYDNIEMYANSIVSDITQKEYQIQSTGITPVYK